jgi:hypothetical protein
MTASGLIECYIAAIPFAGNMLAGNVIYAGLLFGGWRVALEWGAKDGITAKASA